MRNIKEKIIGGFCILFGFAIGIFALQQVLAAQVGGAGNSNPLNGYRNTYVLSDFPAASGGEIDLKTSVYRINGDINIGTDSFILEAGEQITFDGRTAGQSSLTYTGTGSMFDSKDVAIGQLQLGGVSLSAPNGSIFDITSPSFNAPGGVFMSEVVIDDCSTVGTVKNVGIFAITATGFSDCGDGLILDSNGIGNFSNSQFVNWKDTGGTMIEVLGSMNSLTMTGIFITPDASESFIKIDPLSTMAAGGAVVTGNSFITTAGGDFFETGLTGSITVFADAGGGATTVTSTAHGLSNGNTIQIFGTTNYNGSHTVSGVLTNTFVIDEAFVSDDATGTFDSGSKTQIDPEWNFTANGNVPDSRAFAHLGMVTNSTETAISMTNVPVKIAGTFVPITAERFEQTTDGRITYKGLEDINIGILGSFRVDVVTGNNIESSYYFAKNGTVDTGSQHTVLLGNNDFEMVPFVGAVFLSTDDFIEIFIENNDGTQNYVVDRFHLIME